MHNWVDISLKKQLIVRNIGTFESARNDSKSSTLGGGGEKLRDINVTELMFKQDL